MLLPVTRRLRTCLWLGAMAAAASSVTACGGGGNENAAGNGGGSSTVVGSSSTAPGPPPGPCDACTDDEICFENACQVPDSTLMVYLLAVADAGSPGAPPVGNDTFSACYFEGSGSYGGPAPPPAPIAPPGECIIAPAKGPSEKPPWWGGVGTITATSAVLGSATIGPEVGIPYACDQGTFAGEQGPAPGEVIGFSISGSATFPAMNEDLTMPELIQLELVTTYQPGAPVELTWTGTGSGLVTVRIVGHYPFDFPQMTENAVYCRVPDQGSFNVPGGLLDEIKEPSTKVFSVEVARTVVADVTSDTTPSRARIVVGYADRRTLDVP